ncbi:hypothetical protein ACIODT_36860 [Streptomyces sp. NPDC088251]|uniref:hypothetical protein n=1 Tax=unclassified Streptomyces TaxID=2593676 RepID=UPI003812FCB1
MKHDEETRVLPKTKVDLCTALRRDARAGLSNRALQRKYGVGILAVKTALESARPEPPKEPAPRARRLLAHPVVVGLSDAPALTVNS